MDSDPKPLALIQAAIDKGLDPEKLGKLLDLQERYEKSRAVEAFNRAMTACQMEMPAVVKDAENKHTKSTYARLETVNTVIKPVYTRNGFSITCSEGDAKRDGECRITLTVRHCEGHSETVHYDVPIDGIGAKGGQSAMNATQAKGSTFSYGRRYAVCCYFNLTVAGEDTDAQGPYLSDEQVKEINELIEACDEADDPVDFKLFLKWLDVPNLADLPQKEHGKTVRHLEQKLKAAQKKAKVTA